MSKEDPLKHLEEERKKLMKRGATGVSVFVKKGPDITTRDYAKDILEFLKLMDKEHTKVPDKEFFDKLG